MSQRFIFDRFKQAEAMHIREFRQQQQHEEFAFRHAHLEIEVRITLCKCFCLFFLLTG
jgi:hypothetical protein